MVKKLLLLIAIFTFSIGFTQIPTGYYDSATGNGYTLKTQLKNIIDDIDDNNNQPYHDTSVTYGDLWELYKTSDVRNDGKVWDIYSNCDFIFDTDRDRGSGGSTECDVYNREHSFPQSWYGGSNSHPLKADAFHVYPTDKKVNNIRGNFAFGEVLNADYTSSNGSKKGTSSINGPNDSVFEPIDEYKGDIARSLFYVATRYQNEIDGWENNNNGGDNMLNGSADKVFEQWALDMLFKWHSDDPVSPKEMKRNEEIFKHQGNRNPYIDHPEYVAQIWGSVLSTKNIPSIQNTIIYPNPTSNNSITITTPLNVTINSITLYSVIGSKVYQIQKPNLSKNKVKITDLKKGLYLLKITSSKNSLTKKIIVR